jgi:NADH oxidase (H2O2-forming)
MKVVILGNGVAGNSTGSIIRRFDNDADITIVSRENYPEYSACAIPHYLAGNISRKKLFLKTGKDYIREKIKTVFGQEVTGIEPEHKRILLDSTKLEYNKLIIATGSTPIVPPLRGINLNGVFTLKSPGDADNILTYGGTTAVVIGSGPVGVEASIALKKQGLQVYLIEVMDRILPRLFDEKPSSILRNIIEENGIRVVTGERVLSIEGSNRVEGIVTDGSQIECDMVLLGAGMRPNVELARQSGINIGEKGGITIDDNMMTSFDDIYACGDCVEAKDKVTGENTLSLLWHNAVQQGEVAGYSCSGIPRKYPGSDSITSLDVFDSHAVSFGYTKAEAGRTEEVEIAESSADENYYSLVISGGRLIGAQSIGNSQDMGALRCLMLRCDDLDEIRRAIYNKIAPLNLWRYRLMPYLAPYAV